MSAVPPYYNLMNFHPTAAGNFYNSLQNMSQAQENRKLKRQLEQAIEKVNDLQKESLYSQLDEKERMLYLMSQK